MEKSSVLTKKQRIGYGFGIFCDSLIYNMFYTYYLAFLIEIAGIKPYLSSIIIFISIIWDAVTDPIIGNIADRSGKDKRKMMKGAIIPLAVFFVLAWTAIGNGLSSQFLKVLVYTAISMLIWLFYTFYCIPYYAIVAELTEDYDERTKIRSTASLINAIAVGLGNILPALVPTVAIFLGKRFESNSYAVIAALIAVLSIICGFICVNSLKKVYTPKTQNESIKPGLGIKEIFRSFVDILKLKPVKFLLAFVFLYLVASSMIQSNITYLVINCIGMDYDTGIALFIVILVISMAITVPFVEKLSNKKDRKFSMLIFMIVVTAALYLSRIIGFDLSLGNFKIMIVIFPIILGIAQGTFWTLFYPMCYDLVEYDQLINGKRREGTITSLPQFVQKCGSAVGIMLAGQFLSVYGYMSEDIAGKENLIERTFDEYIVNGMSNISSLFPAVILTVAIVFLVLCPLTRVGYEKIKKEINNKNN